MALGARPARLQGVEAWERGREGGAVEWGRGGAAGGKVAGVGSQGGGSAMEKNLG